MKWFLKIFYNVFRQPAQGYYVNCPQEIPPYRISGLRNDCHHLQLRRRHSGPRTSEPRETIQLQGISTSGLLARQFRGTESLKVILFCFSLKGNLNNTIMVLKIVTKFYEGEGVKVGHKSVTYYFEYQVILVSV